MSVTESRVKEILAHPFDHDWSIQGLGMLRTYLDDEHIERLHIWDTDRAVTEVSTIHDHPWDFSSRIVAGRLYNQRYQHSYSLTDGDPFHTSQIHCGAGGGLIGATHRVRLSLDPIEGYEPGDVYSQSAPELHQSDPSRGAVTVISRTFRAERDIATVCWRTGDWVSAEPRSATMAEIEHFIGLACSTATRSN